MASPIEALINVITDVFGTQVSKNTNSELELASHYPYNPERWVLTANGSRVFPEYTDVPQYEHSEGFHRLTPNAGDTLIFQTKERPRYTVQYELAASWALRLNQQLQTGDEVRVGLYDGTDGWYWERDDSHEIGMADFVVERGGVIVERKEKSIDLPLTEMGRFLLETGWYRVTRQRWSRSYAEAGDQVNEELACTGDHSRLGPNVGNLPLRFEVTAGPGTTDLELEAGSIALVTYGDSGERVRQKTHSFVYDIQTTGAWIPVHAFRIDPNREIVDVQLTDTDVVTFSGSGSIRVMPIAVTPSKTDATSWRAPTEHSKTNSVIQQAGVRDAPAVSTLPDATGTPVASATDTGGYQLGYGSWYSTGTGSKTTVSSGSVTRKRTVSARDVVVFAANATTTGQVTVEVITEQDW